MNAIDCAIAHCGGLNSGGQNKLASLCQVNYQTVQYWRRKGVARPIYWGRIVEATNGVVSHERLQSEYLAAVSSGSESALEAA